MAIDDDTVDPAVWGKNFPIQYDQYRGTVDQQRTRFGGSEAVPRTRSTPPASASSPCATRGACRRRW